MEIRARQNPGAAYALLKEEPWNQQANFPAAVRGYASSLRAGADWRQLRADAKSILDERWDSGSVADPDERRQRSEVASLDLAIAREWAERDLDAAIAWYVDELPKEHTERPIRFDRTNRKVMPSAARPQAAPVDGSQRPGSRGEMVRR